jgi:hypothetical protein
MTGRSAPLSTGPPVGGLDQAQLVRTTELADNDRPHTDPLPGLGSVNGEPAPPSSGGSLILSSLARFLR